MIKTMFAMTLTAEDSFNAYIAMTEEEAKIVDRVLTELNMQSEGWCGACYVNPQDCITVNE